MVKTFRRLPGSKWFDRLDPLVKAYMYEHWCRDQEELQELGKMISILTGSFFNPDAAKKMLKADNPDFASDEQDFEKSLEMVKQDIAKPQKHKRHRRQRIVKKE